MNSISAKPNYNKRTFTIRKYDGNGNCYTKLRTIKMTLAEFNSNLHNTENDWRHFLKNQNGDYYLIK